MFFWDFHLRPLPFFNFQHIFCRVSKNSVVWTLTNLTVFPIICFVNSTHRSKGNGNHREGGVCCTRWSYFHKRKGVFSIGTYQNNGFVSKIYTSSTIEQYREPSTPKTPKRTPTNDVLVAIPAVCWTVVKFEDFPYIRNCCFQSRLMSLKAVTLSKYKAGFSFFNSFFVSSEQITENPKHSDSTSWLHVLTPTLILARDKRQYDFVISKPFRKQFDDWLECGKQIFCKEAKALQQRVQNQLRCYEQLLHSDDHWEFFEGTKEFKQNRREGNNLSQDEDVVDWRGWSQNLQTETH